MEAWLGETPAALTSMVMGPSPWAVSSIPWMEARLDRSISRGRASKPTWVRVSAAAWAWARERSPMTMVFPAPTRRVMARPIWPAPVSSSASDMGRCLLT